MAAITANTMVLRNASRVGARNLPKPRLVAMGFVTGPHRKKRHDSSRSRGRWKFLGKLLGHLILSLSTTRRANKRIAHPTIIPSAIEGASLHTKTFYDLTGSEGRVALAAVCLLPRVTGVVVPGPPPPKPILLADAHQVIREYFACPVTSSSTTPSAPTVPSPSSLPYRPPAPGHISEHREAAACASETACRLEP